MKQIQTVKFVILGVALSLALNLLTPWLSFAQHSSGHNQLQKLAQADKLYLVGKRAEAEKLYRQVKPAFPKERANSILQPVRANS